MDSTTNGVVVIDVRMPFWSMVVFMVKWAIAAIPALILLTLIGVGIAAAVIALSASIDHLRLGRDNALSTYPEPSQSSFQFPPGPIPEGPTRSERLCAGRPDKQACLQQYQRCSGAPDEDKCITEERRLAAQTPEQKAEQARALDADRKKALQQVR